MEGEVGAKDKSGRWSCMVPNGLVSLTWSQSISSRWNDGRHSRLTVKKYFGFTQLLIFCQISSEKTRLSADSREHRIHLRAGRCTKSSSWAIPTLLRRSIVISVSILSTSAALLRCGLAFNHRCTRNWVTRRQREPFCFPASSSYTSMVAINGVEESSEYILLIPGINHEQLPLACPLSPRVKSHTSFQCIKERTRYHGIERKTGGPYSP